MMSEKFFPSLRNTTLIIRYDRMSVDSAKVEETCDTPIQTVLDTQDSIPPMPTEQPTESVSDSIGQTTTPIPVSTDRTAEDLPLHRMAIKTNLLYDAILMPSLEVECRIDDRWSVAVEGSVAWWKKDPQHKYYQIATIIPEGRYWFRTKNRGMDTTWGSLPVAAGTIWKTEPAATRVSSSRQVSATDTCFPSGAPYRWKPVSVWDFCIPSMKSICPSMAITSTNRPAGPTGSAR